MDIISFNEASTANGRIESFIENPDSTSGVLTVPKTIAAGETITIPAGRVAILPDLQVDGDLVIDGDLFIPTGSMTSQVVQKVTSTDNAIVRFDGVTGQVQNSTIIIDDAGNMGININAPLQKLHVGGSIIAGDTKYANKDEFIGAILNNNPNTPSLDIRRWNGGATNHGVIKIAGNILGEIVFYSDVKSTNTEATTEKMKLDANGNLLVGTSITNGLDKVQIEGTFSSKAVKAFTGIDLNTLKTRTEVCSVTNSCTNLPIAEAGFLEIFMFDSNSQWVMQRFTAIGFPNASNQGRTYVRNWMSNNTWSAWVEK